MEGGSGVSLNAMALLSGSQGLMVFTGGCRDDVEWQDRSVNIMILHLGGILFGDIIQMQAQLDVPYSSY